VVKVKSDIIKISPEILRLFAQNLGMEFRRKSLPSAPHKSSIKNK